MSLPKDIKRARKKIKILQEIEGGIFKDIKEKYKIENHEEDWLVDYLLNDFGEENLIEIVEGKLQKGENEHQQ